MVLLLGAHWMACAWGYIGREISLEKIGGEQARLSWIDVLAQNKDAGMPVSPGDDAGVSVYVAGIHFAIMTITSIGSRCSVICPQWFLQFVLNFQLKHLLVF